MFVKKPNIQCFVFFFLRENYFFPYFLAEACISRQAYPCPWQEEKCIFNLTSYQLKLLSRWTHFTKVKYVQVAQPEIATQNFERKKQSVKSLTHRLFLQNLSSIWVYEGNVMGWANLMSIFSHKLDSNEKKWVPWGRRKPCNLSWKWESKRCGKVVSFTAVHYQLFTIYTWTLKLFAPQNWEHDQQPFLGYRNKCCQDIAFYWRV